MKLLLSPHNDDAVLFAAFTILREQPIVITCLDGNLQRLRGENVTAEERREEDKRAMGILGVQVDFLGISDAKSFESIYQEGGKLLRERGDFERVWAPAVEEGGNLQHNLIGELALDVFGSDRVTGYLTYTNRGKSTSSRNVTILYGEWVSLKLRALASYLSQMRVENCRPHFLRSLEEYYA